MITFFSDLSSLLSGTRAYGDSLRILAEATFDPPMRQHKEMRSIMNDGFIYAIARSKKISVKWLH